MNKEKFFEIATETADNFRLIMEEAPKDCKHLKQLAESCLMFASFVAHVYDDIQKQESQNGTH